MGSPQIILQSPRFNNLACFLTITKNPAVQTVIAKSAIETFNKRIFPRTAKIDVERMKSPIMQPFLQSISDKFRAIIAADMAGRTACYKEPVQNGNHLTR